MQPMQNALNVDYRFLINKNCNKSLVLFLILLYEYQHHCLCGVNLIFDSNQKLYYLMLDLGIRLLFP